MEEQNQSLTFTATFARAATLVDGGWRISFDVSNEEAKALHILSELREHLLQIAVIAVEGIPQNIFD
jgi:hypothetical protein